MNISRKLSLHLAALCSLLPVASTQAQAPTRILCMGDSLTNGTATQWSNYRGPLFNRLTGNQHCIDFVGTRRGVLNAVPGPLVFRNDPNFAATDQDHFGFNAFQSFSVFQELQTAIANNAADVQCDIALIHLGSNDVIQNTFPVPPAPVLPPPVIAQLVGFSLTQIINALQAQNSNVEIVIAEIIPMNIADTSIQQAITLVNQTIAGLNNPANNIHTVDMNTPLTGTFGVNYFDDVHLNVVGADAMASLWEQALTPILGPNPLPTTACFREVGRGCVASGPNDDPRFLLTNSAIRPTLGTTLPLLATQIPSGAAMGLGLSFAGAQLPTGSNDCFSFLGAPVITGLTPPMTGNQLAIPLFIPNSAGLIGLDIFGQVVMVDPSNTLHLTNGIWARIGN